MNTYDHEEIVMLARTIYGEGRGEYVFVSGGLAGLIGIGNVILNRLKRQTHYGKSIREVCLKPYQFSCWNLNDPNRKIIESKKKGDEKIFDLCYEVAQNTLEEKWPDLTKGSDHYHAVLKNLPKWAWGKTPQVILGRHTFYRLEGETK